MAHVREAPPLRVGVEVEAPSGKRSRWAENEPLPENVPSGLRWSDTMPGGFESCDCVLPRKPGISYSDLVPLSTVRVLGASGDVAWEGRLESSPRTSGDQVSISPGAVGWQANLEDDKSVSEIYVDRDITRWGTLSRDRRLDLLTSNYTVEDASVNPDETSGLPALLLRHTDIWASPFRPLSEALYDAGGGNKVAVIFRDDTARGSVSVVDGNWTWRFLVDAEDDFDSAALFTGANMRVSSPSSAYETVTTPNRYAAASFFYAATPGGANGFEYVIELRRLAVYGDHGLVRRGTDPGGFYGSDIVRHAVGRWASALRVTDESVQQSGFVVPHAAFPEPITVGEIVRQATRFGLQDWAIWDDKTFWWHERGAFSKRWRARVAPAQLDETGPQVDRLWESVIVSYQDVDGSTRTVGPPGSGANTEDAALKDSDPDNPANQLGIIRRDVLQMGTSTAAGATEVGHRFLEHAKLLDRSGRARLVGHVEDDRGVLHPYWRPRAGDYISFLDAADPSPRRIVRTEKDHGSRTCSLDLDAPPEGLQALLERLGVVLVPLGLS